MTLGNRSVLLLGWPGRRLCRGLGCAADGQIFAHFVEALFAEAANGQQVVNTFERPVRLAHLQNFLGRGRTDSRHLLKLFRACRVDIHRLHRRLFLIGAYRRSEKKD